MVVAVTENPVPVLQIWDIPPNAQGRGIPNGQLVYQNSAVVIAAATTERVTISINTAQPLGYVYRLMEARIQMAFPAATDGIKFGRQAEGQIVAFNPGAPGQTINIPFTLANMPVGIIDAEDQPTITDNSSLEFKLMYGPLTPLPNTAFEARSATTVVRLFLAANTDSSGAGELAYYIRVLRYSIEDGERWAIHSPVPVTG